MKSFFDALNRPAEAFRNRNRALAFLLAAVTILIDTIFAPLLSYFAGPFPTAPDLPRMLLTTVYGCLSYLAVCAALFLVCRLFGSKAPLNAYLDTWGMTFFPTLLCSLAVAYSETFFTVFWNNSVWGMLLGIVFIGILIWKTILYVIYLREVAGLTGGRMLGAFAVVGILILALAWLNGFAGLMTPVL